MLGVGETLGRGRIFVGLTTALTPAFWRLTRLTVLFARNERELRTPGRTGRDSSMASSLSTRRWLGLSADLRDMRRCVRRLQ